MFEPVRHFLRTTTRLPYLGEKGEIQSSTPLSTLQMVERAEVAVTIFKQTAGF